MVLSVTSEGKRRWTLSPELTAEIRRRVAAQETLARIATAVGESYSTVHRVAKAMRAEKADKAVAAFAFEGEQVNQVVPVSVCLSCSPEPQRLHVLAWRDRMNAYAFEGPPEQLKPKSTRGRIKSMTPAQLRDELRGHTRVTASQINPGRAINCAAPAPAPTLARTHARTRSRSPFD